MHRLTPWLAGALIAMPLAANAQSYRCVGKDGKRYYGQTIPNQCIGQTVEQLDSQGRMQSAIDFAVCTMVQTTDCTTCFTSCFSPPHDSS